MIGNNHINSMTYKLREALEREYVIVTDEMERTIRKTLEAEWKDKIADIWHLDDIIHSAKETHEIELTREQAENVLESLDRSHDASIGINWDVIDAHIEQKVG